MKETITLRESPCIIFVAAVINKPSLTCYQVVMYILRGLECPISVSG